MNMYGNIDQNSVGEFFHGKRCAQGKAGQDPTLISEWSGERDRKVPKVEVLLGKPCDKVHKNRWTHAVVDYYSRDLKGPLGRHP